MASVEVTWTNNDDSPDGGITVQRSSDGGSTWSDIATGLSTSTTSYTDNNTLDGVTYDYRIQRNTDHTSSVSGTDSLTTTLPAITDLTTPDIRATEADLSWSNPENNATEKRVYLRTTEEPTRMNFNGSGDYIEIPDPIEFEPNSWSIGWRMHLPDGTFDDANSSSRRIFSKEQGSIAGRIEVHDWGLQFESINNNLHNFSFSVSQDMFNEHHFMLVFDTDGTYLYVDGSLEDSEGENTESGPWTLRYIGINGADNYADYFEGPLWNVSTYDHPLSDSEISTVANGDIITNGLRGYWPLDLNRNGVTPDLSSYANHGTVNGPTLTGPSVQLHNEESFENGLGRWSVDTGPDRSTKYAHSGSYSVYGDSTEDGYMETEITVPSDKITISGYAYYETVSDSMGNNHIFNGFDDSTDELAGPHTSANDGTVQYHDGSWQDTGYALSGSEWIYWESIIDVAAQNFDLYIEDSSGRTHVVDNGGFIPRGSFTAGDVRKIRSSWQGSVGIAYDDFVIGTPSNETSYTIDNLLNGEEYEAYVHTLTGDNEVRSQ